MSLVKSSLGKWNDMSCKKTALVVCQKKQDINFNVIMDLFKIQEKEIEILRNNSIPIGFLYTQLPNQSSPQQLWPNMKWSEVTQQYSGLFFRAEGGGAEKFGNIQQANQSWISNFEILRYDYSQSSPGKFYPPIYNNSSPGSWTSLGANPGVLFDIYFYQTNSEVRPKNTAIKIWKRTG